MSKVSKFLLRHGLSEIVAWFSGTCFGMWWMSREIDLLDGGLYATSSIYSWVILGCTLLLALIALILRQLEK